MRVIEHGSVSMFITDHVNPKALTCENIPHRTKGACRVIDRRPW
ncbi:hydrolase [Mycobacterium phage Guillsminger]|nr:hydrolase [Mycobacterium phage Guillsminger]